MRRITQHKRIWIGNHRTGAPGNGYRKGGRIFGSSRRRTPGFPVSLDGSFWIPLAGAAIFFTSLLVPAMASSFPDIRPKPLTVREAMAAVVPISFELDEIEMEIPAEPAPEPERPEYDRTSYQQVSREKLEIPADLPEGWRTNVLKNASAHMGTRYVWGGDEPGGFDCSGFVKYVMEKDGIILPRTARSMKAAIPSIPTSELKPGDLVFFRGPDHVGIYVGDGKFVHASSGQHRVVVSNLNQKMYTRRYIGSGRVTE